MSPTTWQDVALQLVNVVQTVLLAYLTIGVRKNSAHLDDIVARSHRVRSTDRDSGAPGR